MLVRQVPTALERAWSERAVRLAAWQIRPWWQRLVLRLTGKGPDRRLIIDTETYPWA